MLSDLSESIRIPFFVSVAVVAVISVLYFIRETPASDRLTILAFALAGRAWIDARTWGIRQVKADIQIAGNKIMLDKGRIQQLYAWEQDSLWVPKQLNTDVKLIAKC